ncbi:hypothetical protein ACTSKR_15420 [Chitinibacteraceae bacterium HSL-7]
MRTSLLAIALLTTGLAYAEPGMLVRKTALKQNPFLDAPTLAELPANTQLDVTQRKGAWVQVRTADQRAGWVKLLNIRTSSTTTGGGLAKVGNVLRTGSSGTTVTTGVKGLSAGDIQQAQPNYAEVEKLGSYRIPLQVAANRARAQGLAVQNVQIRSQPSSQPSSTSSPLDQRRN